MSRFPALVCVALLLGASSAQSASIECKSVGVAYDQLFQDALDRIKAIQSDFPKAESDQKRDTLRRQFCAAGGELLGLYKLILAMTNECAGKGENMTEVLNVVKDQLEKGQGGVRRVCE